jgi:hypothetical protein
MNNRTLLLLGLWIPVTGLAQSDTSSSLPGFESERALVSYLTRLTNEHEQYTREMAERAQLAANRSCPGAIKVVERSRSTNRITSGSAIIRGVVRADFGTASTSTAVSGATVMAEAFKRTATTGADGRYALTITESQLSSTSTVSLLARRIGYLPARKKLKVKAGDSITVDVTLCVDKRELSEVVVTGAAVGPPALASDASFASEKRASITNTQHAGVDEGGIVKLHGKHLVMLRRGRLFTVVVGDRELRPVSAVDAFGPDIDPRATWYDELLVSNDKVVVIGFSYARGGTEIGLFRIDDRGRLTHLSTHHLRSNDYYSSRNYSSRLIGDKLVLYSPLYFPWGLKDPLTALPSMRKWKKGADEKGFETIVTPRRVFRSPLPLTPSDAVALHTVTTCDVTRAELDCEANVVIGPPARVFYVSPTAVYVWVSKWSRPPFEGSSRSMVYRMPLDGGRPSALEVSGTPVDQFSFLESSDRHLNVLVRSAANGDAMWLPERSDGMNALMRVPLSSFGDGSESAAVSRYRLLPNVVGSTFTNRFVGDYLLFGSGNGWWQPRTTNSTLYATRWRGGDVDTIQLDHGVDRIEVMGDEAVVIGSNQSDLHFSGIRLGRHVELDQRYKLSNASQGETRSHGFFYRHDGQDSGVLGLPVRGGSRPGYEQLWEGSASVLFLRNSDHTFEPLGELEARTDGNADDGCKASCVDWYGNARPLFLRTRVFALLGYELVEGRIGDFRIREVQRVSFAPNHRKAVHE